MLSDHALSFSHRWSLHFPNLRHCHRIEINFGFAASLENVDVSWWMVIEVNDDFVSFLSQYRRQRNYTRVEGLRAAKHLVRRANLTTQAAL